MGNPKVWSPFPQRPLPPNKRSASPRYIVFVDTEGYVSKREGGREYQRLRLGWACYVRRERNRIYEDWRFFTSPSEFWDWVSAKVTSKRCVWLVAHNWHYDFFTLNGFPELERLGFKLVKLAVDSQRFIAKFSRKNGSIVLVDFTNYFKMPLKDIGKWVGVEKLEVDFASANQEELSDYCKRDVEVLKTAFLKLLEWWEREGLGEFKTTAASLAFTAFRHRFMKTKIFVHNHPEAQKLELEAYRGGRTECWFVGKLQGGKYFLLDVNSIYPFVMRNFPYPVRLLHYSVNPPAEKVREWRERFLLIARVDVCVEKPVIGVKNGKLVFPVGCFQAVLTSPELDLAEKHGVILRYHEVAVYEPAFIFSDYVDYFYRLKQRAEKEGDKAARQFAKLLLNSLYGKFGQRTREWEPWGRVLVKRYEILDVYGSKPGERDVVLIIGNEMYRLARREKPSRYSNVAIAAFVTAYARCYLWQLIAKAGEENVYYMDTDSLVVNTVGLERLKDMIGEWLGGLKVEKEFSEGEILAPKHYRFGSTEKRKGLTPRAKQVSAHVFLDQRFLKMRRLLREGVTDSVIIEEVEKKLNLKYDKGVVTESGRVLPLLLSSQPLSPFSGAQPPPSASSRTPAPWATPPR